ncbi:hypothetical protein M9458_041655, partial [Cirrhinus mrigala]
MNASCALNHHLHDGACHFSPDLHTEVSRSWGKPLSALVHSSATLHYSNVVGAAEHGYGVMLRVEQTLASYLSPGVASSLKAPTLPTKPLHTTLALVGKGYSSAGQAGACLHTMAVLQAYQADLLKELDKGEEIKTEDITELRRATDLSLRATKETARAIGRSMAAMVAAERHLWLTLSHVKDPTSSSWTPPSPLLACSVTQSVARFQEAWRQAAALQRYLPRRSPASAAAGREQPHTSTSSSYQAAQKESVATRTPPQREQGSRRRSKSKPAAPKMDLQTGAEARQWRLHPEVVELIWRLFGQAQVDLFATQETSVRLSPDRSAPRSSGESAPRRHLTTASSPVLAGPSMVLGPDFTPRRLSMGDSHQEGSPLTSGWYDSAPPPGVVEAVGVAPEGAHLIASGLSTKVVETILQSRAPSTRKLYAWKWRLYTSWCGVRRLDPVHCPVGTVLEFLQAWFATGLTYSTLKVYVAAIAAFQSPLGGQSVGKHPLVTRFLRGALRLRPPVRSPVPTWDLAVVLKALCKPPFEPLEEVSDRTLTLKGLPPGHLLSEE